jgi:hypothetical protein
MQQQINLYQEAFHPLKQKGFEPLFWVPVGFVLVLLLLSTYEVWKNASLEAELSKATTDYEQLQGEMDQLQLAMKQRGKDPLLIKKMHHMERELRRKKKALALLSGDEASANKKGLSDYLVALSRTDPDELWLENIRLESGGLDIELQGKTLKPEEIPVYLQDLGRYPVYQDKPFHSFVLARDEEVKGLNHFLLSTQSDAELDLEKQE